MDSGFRAGGLASGLDSNAIIDQLTAIEGRQLNLLRQKQTGLKTQVSILGELSSKLSALKSAAQTLGDGGALGVEATSLHTAFTATPGSSATSGRFSVQVTQLAQAAKARSQAFASESAQVQGSTLTITVNGTATPITVADGATLSDVALAINSSGAEVSAAVLSDGTSYYLSITNKDTGHTIGQPAASALTISETVTGALGQPLSAAITVNAANAQLTVDGLAIERTSNEISDVVPGTTLNLSEVMASAQDLVLSNDPDATEENLQGFVDAYNDVIKLLQKHLAIGEGTSRANTLAGDSALRYLQGRVQRLISTEVTGLGNDVRALADVGLKTGRDGTLSIDTDALEDAISRDPSALNSLFSLDTDGLSDVTSELVDGYINSVDGLLTSRSKNLNRSISRMDDDAQNLELRIETFRQNLIRQFTAMEKVVSGLRSIGNFLTQQDAKSSGG